jgi:hypothetical protein
MSERNGDKARFGREHRQKILRRKQTRESRKALDIKQQARPVLAPGEEEPVFCR